MGIIYLNPQYKYSRTHYYLGDLTMIKYSTSHALCSLCNQRILSPKEKADYEDYLRKVAEAEIVWSDQRKAMKARQDDPLSSEMRSKESTKRVDEFFRKHRETLDSQTSGGTV